MHGRDHAPDGMDPIVFPAAVAGGVGWFVLSAVATTITTGTLTALKWDTNSGAQSVNGLVTYLSDTGVVLSQGDWLLGGSVYADLSDGASSASSRDWQFIFTLGTSTFTNVKSWNVVSASDGLFYGTFGSTSWSPAYAENMIVCVSSDGTDSASAKVEHDLGLSITTNATSTHMWGVLLSSTPASISIP